MSPFSLATTFGRSGQEQKRQASSQGNYPLSAMVNTTIIVAMAHRHLIRPGSHVAIGGKIRIKVSARTERHI